MTIQSRCNRVQRRLIPDIPVIHRVNGEYFTLTTRAPVRHFTCSRELTAAEMPKEMNGLQSIDGDSSGATQELQRQQPAGFTRNPVGQGRHANGMARHRAECGSSDAAGQVQALPKAERKCRGTKRIAALKPARVTAANAAEAER